MIETPHAHADIQENEIDDGPIFALGPDGMWRVFDCGGIVAVAPTFREVYERAGGRWN